MPTDSNTGQTRLSIAVIIPVLNEANRIAALLDGLLDQHDLHEIIVVDGGSQDHTIALAQAHCEPPASKSRPGIQILQSETGRARQMNFGAAQATADVLLFLHADTELPTEVTMLITKALSDVKTWGRFDVRLSSRVWIYRVIESLMNMRSAWTGVVTGDQALFIKRDIFRQLQGYADIPLMEDIELSKRLRKNIKPVRIKTPVQTSARRWQQYGVVRTILLMWWLRLLYWFGVNPERLLKMYDS